MQQYTDREKCIAIVTYETCKRNATRAAAVCREFYGINASADQITRWYNGVGIRPEVREQAEELKLETADMLESAVRKMLSVVPEKTSGANLAQIMVGVGIGVDKMLLLRGQPNQIIQEDDGPTRARMELLKLVERYTNAEAGLPIPDTTVIDVEPETDGGKFFPMEETEDGDERDGETGSDEDE